MKYQKRYIDPSVKIVDSTALPGTHYWMESRKNVTEETPEGLKIGKELIKNRKDYDNRIRKMGLQYNNFDFYIFEIDGSVLFRDILYTINKTAQWAVSLRFVHSIFADFDPNNYAISSEYKDIPVWENQMEIFLDGVVKDSKTDNNRLQMPYSVHSKYWVGMNLKTLLALLPLLRNEMPYFYYTYGKLFIEAVKERYPSEDFNHWIKDVKDPSVYQYFDSEYESFSPSFTQQSGIVILKQEMGPLLFSQFIRQSDVIVKGLFDHLKHTEDEIETFKNTLFSSQTPLKVTYIASVEKWNRTISNRTCWFSMSQRNTVKGGDLNSWSSILDLVINSGMTEKEFTDILPCTWENSKCVSCIYHDDVKFRVEGLEKENLPCALAINDLSIAKKRESEDKTIMGTLYRELEELQSSKHPNYSVYKEIESGRLDPSGTAKSKDESLIEKYNLQELDGKTVGDFDFWKFIESID